MATINLIPPSLKKEQTASQVSRVIFASLAVLLLMGLIAFAAIYTANYLVHDQLKEAESSLADQELKNQKLKDLSSDITLINGKLKKITTIKDAKMDWNGFLNNFNMSIPEKVQITTLSADRKLKKVTIAGKAGSRRDIVKLQKKIETLDYFKNMSFSASTLDENTGAYSFSLNGDFVK